MKCYRHGDLLIVATDEISENLKKKSNTVLLEVLTGLKVLLHGESGNEHCLKYNPDCTTIDFTVAPSKANDYLVGYFQTKEGALLTHQEHETIEIPAGIYKFYAQREYDEIDERQVID